MTSKPARAGVALLLALDALAAPRPAAPAATPAVARRAGLPGYEGSGTCASCHETPYRQWQASLHARTLHAPSEAERQLVARALLCGEGEPAWVLGERHARRFLVASPTEPGRHLLLPCRYDVGQAAWVGLHAHDWRTMTWEKGCGACHSAGFSSDDLSFAEMGVGCEACHGPASRHGDRSGRGGMIAFATLEGKDEVTLCASCHLQGGRSKSTGLNYPRNYEAGADLFADYQFDWAALDAGKDATAAGPIDVHQKLLIRDVAVKGAAGLRCTSCHEFHSMGHARHQKLAKQEYCHICHDREDFKLKDYEQSCNVCEF